MILIIIVGYKTAGERLRSDLPHQSSGLLPNIRISEIVSTFFENHYQETPDRISDMTRGEIIRKFLANIFPEKGIEKIRSEIPDPTNTLIVPSDPPELAFTIACETGLNVSYISDRYFLAMATFSKKTISQEQRLKMVNIFYNDLTRGILRKDILSFFNTDIFISPSSDLVKKIFQLEKITSVQIENKEYFLYKL